MYQKRRQKNPGRALEIGANVNSAFASRSPKATLSSLPEVINFDHTGKGFYLGEFVTIMPDKCTKNVIDSTQVLP